MDKNYFVTKNQESNFKNKFKFKNYYVHHNECTVYSFEGSYSKIVILGNLLDILDFDKIPEQMAEELSNLKSMREVLNRTKYYLGRYLIMRYDHTGDFTVIPDATGTIPVYYLQGDDGVEISSSSFILAEKFKLKQSKKAKRIKEKAADQHPLPYNVTMYDSMKIVIPNHFLDAHNLKMVRYYPIQNIEKQDFDFAVDETIRVINQTVEKIIRKKNFSLPITAGMDSRTLLAFFREYMDDIPMYTFYDKGNKDTWDIKVPQMLAEKFELDYYPLERIPISEKNKLKLNRLLSGQQNKKILENSFTLSQSALYDRSFLAGDIIPLAKSNFGKNLPEEFATLSYFLTKTHNYSKENKKYIKKWMEDIKNNFNVSMFDLFFWEHRLGRWLPNNASNYDMFSDPLYIFNCRYLIELWIGISRKERTQNSMHKEIIKRKWPELLEVPINPDNRTRDNFFSNQYIYYLGSYAKYYLNKFKYN